MPRGEGHVLWGSWGCRGISWAQNGGPRRHTVGTGMWKQKLEVRWRRANLEHHKEEMVGGNKWLEGNQHFGNCITQGKMGYSAAINNPPLSGLKLQRLFLAYIINTCLWQVDGNSVPCHPHLGIQVDKCSFSVLLCSQSSGFLCMHLLEFSLTNASHMTTSKRKKTGLCHPIMNLGGELEMFGGQN